MVHVVQEQQGVAFMARDTAGQTPEHVVHYSKDTVYIPFCLWIVSFRHHGMLQVAVTAENPTVHEMHPSRKARCNYKTAFVDWLYCRNGVYWMSDVFVINHTIAPKSQTFIYCYNTFFFSQTTESKLLYIKDKLKKKFYYQEYCGVCITRQIRQQLLWSRSDLVTFTDLSGNLRTRLPSHK